MKNAHYKTWIEYGKETKNHGKWETHTVGLKIWRETFKNVKNEKKTIVRKLNNAKNEIQTLFDRNILRNTEKGGKWEMHTVGPGI